MGIFFTEQEINCLTSAKNYSDIVSSDTRSVYLFGTGTGGKIIYNVLQRESPSLHKRIVGFLNSSPNYTGILFEGLPVKLPDDPAVKASNPFVLLAVYDQGYCCEMEETCRKLGYDCMSYFEFNVKNLPRENAKDIESNPSAQAALDIWDDELSRTTYLSIVRLCSTGDKRDLPPVCPDQYFPDLMPAHHYRSFVDGGAAFGDTLLQFKKRFNDDFDNYYAFEPYAQYYQKMKEETTIGGDPRIRVFPDALYSHTGFLSFKTGDEYLSSLVSESGNIQIPCTSVDSALRGCPVSLIKMDIEGSEPDALKGSQETIAGQHPALVICVYHHMNHLWDIPLWIRRHFPFYRLFLRHHSYKRGETVCYGVPT